MGDPAAERLGLGLAGLEDEGVQAGLGDDERCASTGNPNSVGVGLLDLIFFEDASNGIGANAERVAHVPGDEPRLAGLVDHGADGDSEGVVGVGLDVVGHRVPPFSGRVG